MMGPRQNPGTDSTKTEQGFFNLETAVGRKKAVQAIGVHGEIQKGVVTLVVMSHFWILPGASRGCADFCDPTAVSRFNMPPKN
ncbi:MAG: hypothetical protein O3A59_08010 [Nitrospirae bacterium]|nr:hypothetical protein [Nitrospirota bacterium]